ncbi:helix-turn-helix domain-containing protein [Roseateles koreensis]|uniref:Uncharacterized protein n=1 Tax=Roseateles koreensis TaxID=2987526 RepID=A0ABT5KWW1_9BURK|nr:hypothetical protein [Roseateles koreensis]MDC8787291.1 hypothetical protein [Roseateles koreensis]
MLRLLGSYGPMRLLEIAGFLFPKPSSAATGTELTRRVLVTLERDKLIIRRPNPLGGFTFALTRTGRDVARALGAEQATDGYDSATVGVLALHRSIGTCFGGYLLAQSCKDSEFYNEFQLQHRYLPADIQIVMQFLKVELAKIPDGVFKFSRPDRLPVYYPVEVENGYKKSGPIRNFLRRFYSKLTNAPPELDIRLPLWICSNEEVARYTYSMTAGEPVFACYHGVSPFEISRYQPA